ncbi:hypothetical protein SK128_013222 [Halocaridina rubra]|uniref:Uncharacterized protein n=1 Tax=Halocaridina rubra TaxID=373956 RepID=A0AAN8WEP9_HALRR
MFMKHVRKSAMGQKDFHWTMFTIKAILFLLIATRECSGGCLSIADGEVYSVGGDAVITELLPLHHGKNCDKIGMTEVQVMEATKLAVQKVNELDLVPGVSIGS